MTESTTQVNRDAYAQFEEWLSEQPYWLQDAVWHIYHGHPIDESKISVYADMCIAQAKKENVKYKHLGENESRKTPGEDRISVLKLSDIVGVNALATDASLDFSENGVTVIYGLNGAGKSGFMRIFKQLSGNPYEEPIQPNVFSKTASEKPSCKFLIAENGEQKEITCNLSSKSEDNPLASCDVFDTRISNAYITSTNNVSYQPFVFTVLSEISKIADRVKVHISSMISAITVTNVKIPDEFSNREDAFWIQNLEARSSIPEKYTEWSEEHKKSYEELIKLLDTEKTKGELELLHAQYNAVTPILDDLNAASNAIQNDELPKAYDVYLSDKSKLEMAAKLFADTAYDQDKISVSSTDWKSLWCIAKRYYEAYLCKYNGKHFGEDGSICPLCHQTISGTSLVRFKSVNEYINGTCSENYNNSKSNLKKLLIAIVNRRYSASQIKMQLSSLFDEDEVKVIESAFLNIEVNSAIGDVESAYVSLKIVNIADAIKLLSEKSKVIDEQRNFLENALQDKELAKHQKEFLDLKYHKWVFDNKSNIDAVILNLRKLKELERSQKFLSTNKITTESNALADALITDAYIERFTKELKTLAPKIQAKLEKAPSKKGNSPYKVSLNTETGGKYKPEDILSEGEQRIVALAAFFADATGRNEQTPLIIDDPISSLDLNYEASATHRIVEIAQHRQVIVFTHRISMLTGIEEACIKLGVPHKENYIRSTVRGKGVSDFADIYRGDVKKHLTGIRSRINDVKKKDPDSLEYLDAIGRICQQFRICVERSVEDVLLQGMVHRFNRRIMTNGKINKLTKIIDDDCRYVDDMMTKYSFTEHSQPIDSPPIQIGIDEIDNDIARYIEWISSYRKRMQ